MNLFKKIYFGIKRLFYGYPLPINSEAKEYGISAENDFTYLIKEYVHNYEIKSNIILYNPSKNEHAEIDCLLLYNGNLFAIEIKNWKGKIIFDEKNNIFYKFKEDIYTGEIHKKELKSPFSQINRAIYLLKKHTYTTCWIIPIVYFANLEENISMGVSDKQYFTSIEDIARYILYTPPSRNPSGSKTCFNKAKSADIIKANSRSINCIIEDKSLFFNVDGLSIKKNDIKKIKVSHHFSYDKLIIYLKNGNNVFIKLIDATIIVIKDKNKTKYSWSRIEEIIIGS